MQTNYCCPGCGRGVTVTSQGDLPVAFQDDGVQSVEMGGVLYPLKNEKGESLKCFENGKPVYWTPPPAPEKPQAPAPEPVATH